MKPVISAVHKDCRTPKYKMQVVKSKKGKGSFKRIRLTNCALAY